MQQLLHERIAGQPGVRHSDLVAWLESEHGTGHGHANALVDHQRARAVAG